MKRLLIVVDYQNDFVDGALGFEGAELLDERIARKIDEYRDAGDTVCFTYDTHHGDYLETQEGRKLPIPHCIEGTQGYELYGEVGAKLKESDTVYRKPTFGSVALFERLVERQGVATEVGSLPFESIELVGLVSNMCVKERERRYQTWDEVFNDARLVEEGGQPAVLAPDAVSSIHVNP